MPKNLFRRLTKKFFVIVNITIALFFLIACYVRWFPESVSWIAGFITIISFYLLAALIIFLIFWLFASPRYMLISALVLAFSLNKIRNIIPLRFSSSFTTEKQAKSIRIMSWNVASFDILNYSKTHNTKVFHQMFDLANLYQPDIACFQEMVAGDTIISGENQAIEQYARNLKFPYYSYCYQPKEDWFINLHFGIVIFSKYPIIRSRTISHDPNDYNSTFQYTDLQLSNSDTIRVFNIHLESLRFTKKNFDYLHKDFEGKASDLESSKSIFYKMKRGIERRRYQANWIKEEINKSPYPVVVCGDLNDIPNSYAYETIGESLENAFVEKGNGVGRTFSSISPTLRIDNIFLEKRFTVKQYYRVKKRLSDHFPIIADISMKEDPR